MYGESFHYFKSTFTKGVTKQKCVFCWCDILNVCVFGVCLYYKRLKGVGVVVVGSVYRKYIR